jgi:hypothetical protein
MSMNWDKFLSRLATYPEKLHVLRPPCRPEKILDVEADLGKLPEILLEMLSRFNGAKLFAAPMPSITIFGISEDPILPPMQWASTWYINKFTTLWRSTGRGREHDWAFAMRNYGGVAILKTDDSVREWDTAAQDWLSVDVLLFEVWIEEVMRSGDTMLREIGR